VDLREAAARLGVHYQTAYRWVREGALRAGKIGQAYVVTDEEVERFIAERSEPVPPPKITHVRNWPQQAVRLHKLLAAGDELGARTIIDRFHEGGIEALALCSELFTPAMCQIGEDWASGALSVAQEHRAAEICERLLARVAVHPRGRPRGVAVACTPPGELHALPSLMAAIVLRAERWQVHHLGADVPTDDLVALVKTVGADVVVLSVSQHELEPSAAEVEQAVTSTGVAVLTGSPGASLPDLLDQINTIR
jgi:excisionase family DNA binding protein